MGILDGAGTKTVTSSEVLVPPMVKLSFGFEDANDNFVFGTATLDQC